MIKNLLVSLFLIFVVICFSGCSYGSPYRQVKPNEIIQNRYVSAIAPSTEWEISKTYKGFSNAETGLPYLYKDIQGSRYTINIQTFPFKWMPIDILFDKDGDYEERARIADNSEYIKNRNKEQGISYDHDETQYLKNMKCLGTVFSRNHGGTIYSATTKNYSITCGYYDKTIKESDGKRLLLVDYKYNYTSGNTRLQKDKDLKREQLVTQAQAENGLKQAVKRLVRTIKIKNFDRDRMQKEGLMHYDKEFESTKW